MEKYNIAIIDYEMSNLFSVKHACLKVGLNPVISNDSRVINNSHGVILPGVGAFSESMGNLQRLKLIDTIYKIISDKKPFMGICLGFQLLFTQSEEFGITKGLNIIKGKVKRFPNFYKGRKLRIPFIGWNRIYRTGSEGKSIFNGIKDGEFMYFVHSYFVELENVDLSSTKTNYNAFEYCSSIFKDNIFASQFHPEKSGKEGLKIYKNFASIIKEVYK